MGSRLSLLPRRMQRNDGHVKAEKVPLPPGPGFFARGRVCKPILVVNGADIERRRIGKRIRAQEMEHLGRTLQQANAQIEKPWILLIGTESSEPHLPIQARLMRRNESRAAHWVAGFESEFVSDPGRAVLAPF